MVWVLFGVFTLLLALNIPVAYAMLVVSIGYLVWNWNIPFIVVAQQLGAGTDQFLLLSIPFFYLAGEFMAHGGITARLVNLARALVGHFRGGLGHVTVVSSMLFSGISGSAVADMAALGKIEIGMMRAAGYPLGFAAAIKSAAATLGPIIPPSIPLLVYGSMTDTSVGKLFLAGFVPGLLMTIFLMVAVTVVATRRNFPLSPWVGWGPALKTVIESIPVLMLPVIILGGIFGGLFTPTEAAIVSAAYALVVGMIIGDLKLKNIPAILVKVAVESAHHDHPRRCSFIQLDSRARTDPRSARFDRAFASHRAVAVPARSESSVPVSRRFHGDDPDHGDRDPGALAHRESARHRPRSLRGDDLTQPDDRPDPSANRHVDVHCHVDDKNLDAGICARDLALPLRPDRRTHRRHVLALDRPRRPKLLLRVIVVPNPSSTRPQSPRATLATQLKSKRRPCLPNSTKRKYPAGAAFGPRVRTSRGRSDAARSPKSCRGCSPRRMA
jgi:hypothetical protein